ncbi:hypothetical protein [Tardiphaga sp.]|uniref:hypothetical protein n=1 Tax=Tardiphaga sp. TaxID=1926292 RepID=UPI002614105C|nr:hypothetical protein [Tardiphaga sp.]MDB5616202.1 hypothetical protein [Tardiphaga sp.]
MRPDILIPVLMGCALLWWIGRGIGWALKLMIAAVTLALIAAVLLVERGLP